MKYLKIAESLAEIFSKEGSESIREWEAGGKQFCLVRKGDQVHACAQRCPHAGARMAEGHLDARGNLVCPLHRYRFDVSNGRNVSGEGYWLKTYPVEVRSDGVYVAL
jgi:3-phenylpropionate/trans-cinnamate dioxygenase ferredoxin subunit